MKENLIDINRLKRFKVKLDNRYPILEDGIIPEKYMPSYVDDVLEFDTQSSFPATGESGKIYLTADTNKSYRWTGSGYAEISSSLALGETSATAYRGDRGKIAYDHSQKSHSLTIAGNSVSALGGTLTKDTLLTSLGLSSAASDITSLKAHVANGDIHVTADDKTTWNSAVDTLDTHTKDTTIHITSDERTKWNNNIANLSTHIADSTKHITASERKAWNAKWDYNEATIKAVKVNNATTADKVGHTLTFADGTTFNGSADKTIGKAQVGLDKVENKTITVTSSSVSDGTNTFNKYTHPTHSAVTIASADGRVLGSISVNSLGHVTSVGYKALGFADIPSLYIGKTKVQSSAAAQALTGISSITLEGSTAALKWDDDKSAWRLSGNLLVDGFVASGGTGSSGGSSGGAVDVSYVANLTAGTLLGTLTINGTDYQILAPSLTASSINAALGNTPVARATADAEGNSISGTYAKTSSLPTKVSQLTNDSGYLTGITKAMVESVLTGGIESHTHSYLPLSGGTISSSATTLVDLNSTSGTESGMRFHLNSATKGWIGYNATYGTHLFTYADNSGDGEHHTLGIRKNGNGYIDTNTILHSGNIKEQLSDVNTATSWRFFYSTLNATNKPTGAKEYITGVTFATDNNPDYQSQIGLDYDGKVFSRIEAGGKWYDWKQLAFLDSNVASATNSDMLDGYHHTSFAKVESPNNLIHFGNEFTFVPSAYSDAIYINYRTAGGTNGAITAYNFHNGAGNFADIRAAKYVVNGGTSSQFLKADGSLDSTSYLSLSGGVLSDSWSGGTEIRRKDSNNGYASLIFSQSDGTILGRFGFGGVDKPLFITQAGGYNPLIHSGNIGSYAFVPKPDNLISNVNADNYLSNGVYLNQTGNGSGNSNFPSGYSAFLTFHQSQNYGAQISIGNNAIYMRRKIDSWGHWMRIIAENENGNVGIGTTSPSAKLHVNGSLRASSLTLNGSNLLEWDESNSAWKFNGNLIATGFIASGDISAQAAALAEEEDRIAALEAQVAELQAEIENLKAS